VQFPAEEDEVVYASPTDVLKLAGDLPPSPERDDLTIRASGIWAADVPDQALGSRAVGSEFARPSLVRGCHRHGRTESGFRGTGRGEFFVFWTFGPRQAGVRVVGKKG
jgi:hypothetical protein